MKLRTVFQDEAFEFGEVADVAIATTPDGRIMARATAKAGGEHTFYYDTIEALWNDWKDYKEPKKTWFIDTYGSVRDREAMTLVIGWDDKPIFEFETKEEAERAVERLKAWKRLKNKGFRFDGYDVAHNSNGDLCGQLFYNAGDYCIEDVEKDLDLLFGGEDEK